jgi:predicted ATPase
MVRIHLPPAVSQQTFGSFQDDARCSTRRHRVHPDTGFCIFDRERFGRGSDAIIELAKQHNLMHYFCLNGQLMMGWVMAREGEAEAGPELMRRSVTERGATEARWYQPRYLCMLAESYLWHGRAEDGLIAAAEADAVMTQTGQYIWAAEIQRVEGELRRLAGALPDEAETYFQRALTIAREQKAKSFELRAAISLARLWRDNDRRGDAHALLAPVCGWFTEGFDTDGLKEAKTLLKELA